MEGEIHDENVIVQLPLENQLQTLESPPNELESDENSDNLGLEDLSENDSANDCLSCSYKDNSINTLTRTVQEYRNKKIELF